MNYRLNLFGFLASQEIADAGVGNLGLQDRKPFFLFFPSMWLRRLRTCQSFKFSMNRTNELINILYK